MSGIFSTDVFFLHLKRRAFSSKKQKKLASAMRQQGHYCYRKPPLGVVDRNEISGRKVFNERENQWKAHARHNSKQFHSP